MSIHFIEFQMFNKTLMLKLRTNSHMYLKQSLLQRPQHLGISWVHHQAVGDCLPPLDAADALASTGQLQGKQRESISLHSLHPSGHPLPIPQLQDISPAANQ
jgi:hypothetical protein